MTSKSHTHATTAAALALGMLAHGAAQAVVEAGHWRYSGSASGIQGSNFNVHVDQNQAQDYTGVFLKYANGVLQGVTYNVDEGADIFVVQPGTAFTAAWGNQHPEAFLMGTSKERSSGPDDRQLTPATGGIKVGTDFYLGVQTRSGTYTGFTVFGWAHFKKRCVWPDPDGGQRHDL